MSVMESEPQFITAETFCGTQGTDKIIQKFVKNVQLAISDSLTMGLTD